MTIPHFPKHFQDVFKTFSTRLQDFFKTSWKTKNCTSWKTRNYYAEDVFKTSWKPKDFCWDVCNTTSSLLEIFSKNVVLKKNCKIHREMPPMESFFNKDFFLKKRTQILPIFFRISIL